MLSAADIKFIKSLKERSARDGEGLFVAEGDKLIGELIGGGVEVAAIFATDKSNLTINSEHVSEVVMGRLTHLRTASSSLALFKIPSQVRVTRRKGLTLVLDGVQDPGNMGTIIRLAHWYGVGQIFCSPHCADCYSPKVVQATMGAIASVEVIYVDLVEFLKGENVAVYGTFLERSENIYGVDLSGAQDAIVVLGSEGRGISQDVELVIDRRLHIPSFAVRGDGSESLNVGVAAAIVVSEFRRR